MTLQIELSERSKDMLCQLDVVTPRDSFTSLTLDDLNQWLRQERDTAYTKEQNDIFESLKPSLLHDLKAHLKEDTDLNKKEKKISWRSRGTFGFLMVAGLLLEGIEGFNGIYEVLKDLFSITGTAGYIIGGFFSLVSMSVFYAFELNQISKYYGVTFLKGRDLLDTFVEQLDLTRAIQLEIGDKIERANLSELEDYKALLVTIEAQYEAIDRQREIFDEQLNKPEMKAAKIFCAVTAGILYAAGGFLAASLIPTTSPVVVVLAPVMALAAFGTYWLVQRPYVQNLLAGIWGLDHEKIATLGDKKAAKKDRKNLSILKGFIKTREELLSNQNESVEMAQTESSADSSNALAQISERSLRSKNPGQFSSVTKQGIFSKSTKNADNRDGGASLDVFENTAPNF